VGIVFGVHFPSVKPSAILFFLPVELATECGITDKKDAKGRFLSVI